MGVSVSGYLSVFMGIYESMDVYGYSTSVYEYLWGFMGVYGFLRVYGYLWISMGL